MDATTGVLLFVAAIVVLFVLSIVFGSFFTVETSQVALVQRLGKFARVAGPGLNWKTPFLETVVSRMSLKCSSSMSKWKQRRRITSSFRFPSPSNTK